MGVGMAHQKVLVEIACNDTGAVLAVKTMPMPHRLFTLDKHAMELMDRRKLDQSMCVVNYKNKSSGLLLDSLNPSNW